ncbi:LLM class flavin-dependent oxidoreductase [Heyndrickxia ginsengihumi]|uniref:LLM class flavin-dependent oxidoreductase n=1 Tax=Heyndrickxia ginsengihumi TaxID=363870 RepID=UPI003D23FC04
MKEDLAGKHAGMEIGIYSLADVRQDPHTGKTVSTKQRIQEIIKAAKMADEAGLDVFGVGEHHRLDYAVSAPAIVLSAIAQTTKQIKLTSATTVLSTIDPVRLFEDFATLDLLSDGRAEMMVGRGAFIECFPLFGYSFEHYDQLFEENIDLLLKLNSSEKVSWKGQFRSELMDAEISPRPVQKHLPVWIGVGGTLESAARAGRLGTGLALAILGGDPARFKPLVDIYHQSAREAGHAQEDLKVGVTGHCYISETSQKAKDEFFPYYLNYWGYSKQPSETNTPISREDFEQICGPDTALFVGSPQQIIEKIMRQYELFGHQRFIAQTDIGGMPFKKVAENIEKLATEVAPVIRRETSK